MRIIHGRVLYTGKYGNELIYLANVPESKYFMANDLFS